MNLSNVPQSWNQTNIVLILKVPIPSTVSDYRPISLCNVIYKLVDKVSVNRLRPIISRLITEEQNALFPGIFISDNVSVAREVIEFIRKKKTGKAAYAALKIDMSKDYDRVSWGFFTYGFN